MIRSIPIRILLSATWLLASAVVIAFALNYEQTNGAVGITSEHWPAKVQIPLDPKHDTLLMFAHPKCPCTRASMDELSRLMEKSDGKISAYVLFLKPKNFSDDWVQASLWKSAMMIPDVTVKEDPEGLIAQQFGAETSGYVLLYAPNGQLLFSGGITGSRGHAGDNAGEDAIIELATGQNPGITHTMVYGCSLLDKSSAQECLSNESTNCPKN
jgi:hypothetical protein